MKYKAVIFDMDGVIFDSERLVLECWKEIAKRENIEDMEEVFRRCIGTNTQKTKEILFEHYGQEFAYDNFRNEASKLFHSRYDNGRLPMKKGIKELLLYLKEQGIRIGLASSTRYKVVHQELQDAGILSYFQSLTCGDMVKQSKPEPEIFLKACESLSVDAKEAIAIEDSFNGIRAAHRAGMLAVMVPDMVAPNEEMRELAGKIFKDLLEVKDWMQREIINTAVGQSGNR